ncbi:MAG: tetratricopeptide repeat protein [Magnetococcales bacterium]|nr:tetratricopeptide repeat protein [Magnetococcales bacterium]
MTDLMASALRQAKERTLRVMELVGIAEEANTAGQVDAALELYKIWLEHNADDPIAYAVYFNYGVILSNNNHLLEAKASFGRAIQIHPDFLPPYINLGNVIEQLEGASAAEACWQQLVDRLPTTTPETMGYKLSALRHIARVSDSPFTRLYASAAGRSMERSLGAPELIGIAIKLSDAGEEHKMARLYSIWLEHNADDLLAHAIFFNYGTYLNQGEDAEGARHALQEAIRLNPDFYPAYINLGNVLDRLGDTQAAVACWQAVVNKLALVRGDTTEYKLAALKQIARVTESLEQAENVLRESLEINPDQREITQQWINKRQAQCKWPVIQPFNYCSREQLLKGPAPLSAALYTDDPLFQLANAVQYNRFEVGRPSLSFLDSHAALLQNRSPKQPLRIGYLSSDLRDHAVGYLTAEIYELHNRENVELFLYYIGIPTNSPFHHRIKAAADHWVDFNGVSDEAAARRILADKIDIIVDLNAYTHSARLKLLAMRPAPIIVNWLGYPGTTGSPYHHYIIADDFIIPQHHEIYYSEKVMRLPCYQPNDRKRILSPVKPTRQEAGLPEEGMVYSCLNGAQKITPAIWKLWMEILQQVPESVLWLLNENEEIRNRLRGAAVQHGVDAGRLIFAERKMNPEHVVRFPLTDLSIDSAPYGSHTTASDALWMGVPVLTLTGLGFASRVCGSLVKSAGLEELICYTPESYVAKAVELGRDREKLRAYRAQLVAQRDSCVLFDTPLLVNRLEGLYAEMWAAFEQGRLPRPDLSNLELYQEIAIELDTGGVAVAEDESYRARYREKLAEKNRYCFLRSDSRLWTEEIRYP